MIPSGLSSQFYICHLTFAEEYNKAFWEFFECSTGSYASIIVSLVAMLVTSQTRIHEKQTQISDSDS